VDELAVMQFIRLMQADMHAHHASKIIKLVLSLAIFYFVSIHHSLKPSLFC